MGAAPLKRLRPAAPILEQWGGRDIMARKKDQRQRMWLAHPVGGAPRTWRVVTGRELGGPSCLGMLG